MDAYFERFEKLLNRKLTHEEKERLHRIKVTLEIADNDALWDIIIAMEYQRTFYEALPQKIEQSTSEVLKKMSATAKKEVAVAQANLSKSVIEQAKKLSTREHMKTWLLWGSVVLILVLLYGSFMAWLGYGLGAGKIQGLPFILNMPVGFLVAGLLLCSGIFMGICAAKAFSEVDKVWRRYALVAVVNIFLGVVVISISSIAL